MEINDLELLDNYLDGLLSGDDLVNLKRRLKHDTELQSLLEYVKFERNFTASIDRDNKKAQIKSWKRNFFSIRKRNIYLFILALFLIILFFAIRGFTISNKNTVEEDPVIALYYNSLQNSSLQEEEDRGDLSLKKETGTIKETYFKAHQLFREGFYSDAEKIFQTLTSHEFLGLDAKWYTLLSDYAQNKKRPDPEPLLLKEILADPKHPHYQSANELKKLLSQ